MKEIHPLITELNSLYLSVHTAKEDSFWALYMALKGYEQGSFERNEQKYKTFISDSSWIPKLKEALKQEDLSDEEETALKGWLRFFKTNAVENHDAAELLKEIISLEGELNRKREEFTPGYTDPDTGKFTETGSSRLSLIINTHPSENRREAAWEGLRAIEPEVLKNGFPEIVAQRNRLGRMLGYEDYYDYKVQINEGISKRELFEIMDQLVDATEGPARKIMEDLKKEKYNGAAKPWNYRYYTRGDLTVKLNPYFPFSKALPTWGKSYTGMGIRYRDAELTLDLLYRKGKHENGFMHGPGPCYTNGKDFIPARINFTAAALPSEPGGGQRALETLMHEGGHAAHFSNILMPAPCFSQEFAPTSVALAETQSMFLDYLLDDPSWMNRYALDLSGKIIPAPLVKETVENNHKYLAMELRALMTISYAEKAIYELNDSELNPENILKTVRETERRFFMGEESPRPVLSVPHLLAGESSAYYHAYTLAWMGVFQTRSYFHDKYGFIVDNPRIGPDLEAGYWRFGNEKNFFEAVKNLTGSDFSIRATEELVKKSIEDILEESRKRSYLMEKEAVRPEKIDLDARITMVHGDETIADNGGGFEKMAENYAARLESLINKQA